jgi:hypothetical protein
MVAASGANDKDDPPPPPSSSTVNKKVSLSLSLQIDTSVDGTAPVPRSTATPTPRSTASHSPNPAQDIHPYAKGAVIEVWHIPKSSSSENQEEKDQWYWTESSDDDDDDDDDSGVRVVKHPTGGSSSNRTVRLCDIIDRAPAGDSWRYYVHYRDFNRRMDEWISIDRIVSPPSVGNAKARALKREEERLKKKMQRKEEKATVEVMDWTGPRSRRRNLAGAETPVEGETAATRRTRTSRRKSSIMGDDDGTVVASNIEGDDEEDENPNSTTHLQKEILALPTDAVTTHTIGDHVVATVKAQELDEHEGLDEASLREHEEVTKIKTVGFLEMGQYQMETWYYSPLPKELFWSKGFIEGLYCCEFTLNLFARKSELLRYHARLPSEKRHPPGKLFGGMFFSSWCGFPNIFNICRYR